MNQPFQRKPSPEIAFTLIELLVVIGIIAVLAGLLLTVRGRAMDSAIRSRAKAEETLIATAIEDYKASKGFYPPDNANDSIPNQLYFELEGTVLTNNNTAYVTLDGSYIVTRASLNADFHTDGLANSAASAQGTDNQAAPVNFLKDLKTTQYWNKPAALGVRVLVCSADNSINGGQWHYSSSHPTNNPSTYDLWVDLLVGGKTNRVSNWSKEAQVLP